MTTTAQTARTAASSLPTQADSGPAVWLRVLWLIPGALVGLAMIVTSTVTYDDKRYFTLVDDALISMSYARTLAQTGEFVWFPGADRVEGITNPLHALMMTLPQMLGLDPSASVLVVSLIGLAWVLVAAYAAGLLAKHLGAGTAGQLIATVTVSLLWPLLFWSVFGLEVATITALGLVIAVLAAGMSTAATSSGRLVSIAVLSAAGVWTRMDFLVTAGVVALWCIVVAPTASARVQRAFVLLGSLAAAMGLLIVARLWYFGEITPNTYALKMTGTSALERVPRALGHVDSVWLFLGLLLVGLAVLWWRGSGAPRSVAVLVAVLAFAQFGYAVYTGGDAFTPDRFFTPGMVTTTVLAISAADVAARSMSRSGREAGRPSPLAGILAGAVALLVLAVTSSGGYTSWWRERTALPLIDVYVFSNTMLLTQATSPEAVIAVYGAGATYWSQRPAIDLLGKNDPVIAEAPLRRDGFTIPGHDKWNYARSIVEQRPDVVAADLLQPASLSLATFPATADELAAIGQNYQPWCIEGRLPVIVRNDTNRVNRAMLRPCPAVTG